MSTKNTKSMKNKEIMWKSFIFFNLSFFVLFVFFVEVLPAPVFSQESGKSKSRENRLTDSPDRVFLDALLEAGLYRLAEIHCDQRMKSPECSPALQAELTMEWMRVVLEQSLAAGGKTQRELREKAGKIRDDFRREHAESPWMPVVEYQWGIGLLAVAQRLCLEGQAAGDDPEKMEEARKFLRDAIKILKTLDKTLENIPPDAPQKTASRKAPANPKAWSAPTERFSRDGLSVWERVSLRNNIQYQLLLAFQCQGESYPPGSDDRISSLEQAAAQVKALWGLSSDSALMWNIRLAEIVCLRLQENYAEIRKRLAEWKTLPMTEEIQQNFLAERMRMLLAVKDFAGAQNLWDQEFSPEMVGKNGNLDCAFLEFLVAMWVGAIKEEESAEEIKKWHESAFWLRNEIRQKDSPQWTYRAEILFSRMLEAAGTDGAMPDDLNTRMLLAENAARGGDVARAISACRRAWEKAVEVNDAQAGVKVGIFAAATLYHEDRIREAMDFYRITATTFPNHPDAMKNHHVAVYLASRLVRDALREVQNHAENDPGEEIEKTAAEELLAELNAAMDLYEEILAEHYRMWSEEDPEILKILKQMEEVFRMRGKRKETVDVAMLMVRHTPAEDAEYGARLRAAVDTRNTYLQFTRKQAAEAELRMAVERALAWSQSLLKTLPAGESRVFLLLQNARWRLEYLPKTSGEAEITLREVLASEEISAETRAATQCLLILATVTQGRSEHVSEMLQEVSRNVGTEETSAKNVDSLLAILKSLQQFSKTAADQKSARQYAQLQLNVVELLEKEAKTLPAAAQNELNLAQAQALTVLGQTGEALSIYEKLAPKFPKNRAVQTTYAQLLTEDGEKTKNAGTLKKAQAQWREVEKNSQQKSEAWYAAKYEIMRIYILLDETENARKMYETFRVLYPELGGQGMRKKFETLFR